MESMQNGLDESDALALVVVMNRRRDWDILHEEGWYRIPVARAPRQMAADYLAFYHTAAFEEERWSIRWYAPVLSAELARRRDLLPDEPAHPHADALYFRLNLGALEPLPRPIPSRRLRRITFIPTTLERLLTAGDVADLWIKEPLRHQLWVAMNRAGIHAQPDAGIPGLAEETRFDFVIPCRRGGVAVRCAAGEDEGVAKRWGEALPAYAVGPDEQALSLRGWSLLEFGEGQDVLVPRALRQVAEAVRRHGGQW